MNAIRTLEFAVLLLVPLSANAATEFTPLGDLPDGDTRSFARDVSADGSVVVGLASSAPGLEAFRWTSAGGMVGLGRLGGGTDSQAYGVSDDGSVVAGEGNSADAVHEAFNWTAGAGIVSLGDLPGNLFRSEAFDISADGEVVVGVGQGVSGGSGLEAFRWTAIGDMVGLGSLAAGNLFFS